MFLILAEYIGRSGIMLNTPTADGTAGQALVTDGNKNLSFATVGTTPGGSGSQLQYRAGASSFGGITGSSFEGGLLTVSALAVSQLQANRVVYTDADGLLVFSDFLTYDPAVGLSLTGALGANGMCAIGSSEMNLGYRVWIKNSAVDEVVCGVNSVGSQTADLQRWLVNGTQKASMSAAGALSCAGLNVIVTGETSGTDYEAGRFDTSGSGSPYVTIGSNSTGGGYVLYEKNNAAIRFGIHSGTGYFARFTVNGCIVGTSAGGGLTEAFEGVLKLLPHTSTKIGLVIRGATSQSATLLQLQGVSSTSTVRAHADLDTAAIDNTDATRKYRCIHRAYDTAAREYLRGWADGSNGRIACAAPASAPTDSHLAASQISFYLDEAGHNLLVRAKYADGTTLKLATIPLA